MEGNVQLCFSKKNDEETEKCAQITVFLSLIFMCIVSLLLLLAESARMAGIQCSFQIAADSSLDSVMSQYHRELWDEYQILLLDLSEEEIKSEFEKYMEYYSFGSTENEIGSTVRAVDDGAWWVEKEIAEYMKYGIWTLDFKESEVEEIWNGMSGAKALATTAEGFSDCTREMLKLEKIVKKLANALKNENESGDEVRNGISAQSESSVRRAVKAYEKESDKVQSYLLSYEKTAGQIRKKIEKIKIDNQEKRSELNDNGKRLVEQEEQRYDTYVALDGERYCQILQAGQRSEQNKQILQEVLSLAEVAVEDAGYEEFEMGESGVDGGSHTESNREEEISATTWDDVRKMMTQYESIPVLFQKTEGDEEKADILERLKMWMEGDVLTLLLGSDADISDIKIPQKNLPSKNQTERGNVDMWKTSLSALGMNAYVKEYFSNYRSVGESKVEESKVEKSKVDESKSVQYETEYLLSGKTTDRENLREAVQNILEVRTGLNLLYLYTDIEKKGEADSLAATIMGSTGLTPLTPILSFFILSVWSLAEAIMDVKVLLNGNKVPVWKTDREWNLSLESVLHMAEEKMVKIEDENNGEEGMDYGGYLRLLLLLKSSKEKVYRMLDLMQIQIAREQPDFQIGNCYYSVGISAKFCGKHFYHAGQFVDNRFWIQVRSQKAY